MTPPSPEMARTPLLARLAARLGLPAASLLLCAMLATASPYFLTWRNLADILRQCSINGILAVGMTFVILAGGIDLSVGSLLALSGIASGLLAVAGHSLPLVLACGAGCGLLLGALNGVLIAGLRVPAFVATLGLLSAGRGLTYILSDGSPVVDLPAAYLALGSSGDGALGTPVLVFAGVALLAALLLRHSVFGRYVYAVGGNAASARTAGIAVRRVVFAVHAICGALAGVAGMIQAARTTSALPQAGQSYELDAIAAVVIGGTTLSGGQGGVGGTVFGVLLIGVINNGLNLLGVSSYYQQVFKGLIIVLAVLVDILRKRRR